MLLHPKTSLFLNSFASSLAFFFFNLNQLYKPQRITLNFANRSPLHPFNLSEMWRRKISIIRRKKQRHSIGPACDLGEKMFFFKEKISHGFPLVYAIKSRNNIIYQYHYILNEILITGVCLPLDNSVATIPLSWMNKP